MSKEADELVDLLADVESELEDAVDTFETLLRDVYATLSKARALADKVCAELDE